MQHPYWVEIGHGENNTYEVYVHDSYESVDLQAGFPRLHVIKALEELLQFLREMYKPIPGREK